jgi:hypothetical protein
MKTKSGFCRRDGMDIQIFFTNFLRSFVTHLKNNRNFFRNFFRFSYNLSHFVLKFFVRLRLNTREDTKRGQHKVFPEYVIASNKQFQRIDYKNFGKYPTWSKFGVCRIYRSYAQIIFPSCFTGQGV